MDNADIIEKSNLIKQKGCEICKERLKGILSDEQLQIFEDVFYKVARNYIFKEKEN